MNELLLQALLWEEQSSRVGGRDGRKRRAQGRSHPSNPGGFPPLGVKAAWSERANTMQGWCRWQDNEFYLSYNLMKHLPPWMS